MKKLFRIGPDKHGGGDSSGGRPLLFSWQPRGNFLATVGRNAVVHIWDRHGEKIPDGEIACKGQGPVLAVEWDAAGECVAVLQEGNGVVELWDINTRTSMPLDTNLTDPTFLKWSTTGPELAIGTAKGNLLLYNEDTRRKVPVLGKHPRRITCGAWGLGGKKLAMGSEDRTMTISDREGNTEDQRELKQPALEMCFAMAKGGGADGNRSGGGNETHLSVNLGTSLLLYDLRDPDNPLELAFQAKYGRIVKHCWFDDGHIMLGFSEGFLVVISTLMQEIGEELYSARFHSSTLTDVAYSPHLQLAACAGDGGVKVVDCSKGFDDVKQPELIVLQGPNNGGNNNINNNGAGRYERCSSVGWSPDGQILTVASTSGCVHGFLARMQIVHASYKSHVAFLSSLKEVSVVDVRTSLPPVRVVLSLEPQFLALGNMHVAAGSGSRVVFHRCLPEDTSRVGAGGPEGQEYGAASAGAGGGRVEAVKLNDRYAAVLAGGRVTLHELEPGIGAQSPGPGGGGGGGGAPIRRKVFPEENSAGSGSPVGKGGRGNNNRASQSTGDGGITAVVLTEHLLIYGTKHGNVEFFLLEEWASLEGATMHHSVGVKELYPNHAGTRVVVLDADGDAFVGNAVTAELTPFPLFPKGALHVMWDQAPDCAGVILAWDARDMHTYIHAPSTVKGPLVAKLGPVEIGTQGEITVAPLAMPLPPDCTPIVSHYGDVTCQDSAGNLTVVTCPHFAAPKSVTDAAPGSPTHTAGLAKHQFTLALMLLNLKGAWDAALRVEQGANQVSNLSSFNSGNNGGGNAQQTQVQVQAQAASAKACWYALSYKAMELMDVALAVRVYRQLGDAGMVMGLDRLRGIEDKKLLAGHIALLYDDYARAQELFLGSSRPVAALEMRRDLLHWDQALKLSQTLAPDQEPEISVEYARQLEFKGDCAKALRVFETALAALQDKDAKQLLLSGGEGTGVGSGGIRSKGGGGAGGGLVGGDGATKQSSSSSEEMQSVALAGIARCTLRLGDLRRGLRYVTECGDPALCLECARILESMQTVADSEAAQLYELGGAFDKAAAIYIKSAKTLPTATAIIHKVHTPKLLCEYALRCEREGSFEDACGAYTRARDMDSVVRLCLDELGTFEKAFEVVRSTASATGAQLVADYCKRDGNYRGAIEFLLLAKCSDDAFVLAKTHDCMDVFTKTLGDGIGSSEAAAVAAYYEVMNDLGQAGHFYSLCGQYARALKLYLQCGDKEVERAIEVVGKARNDTLTHTLIDFLMGETDGVPKEPFHVYRLYLALGNYAQAASTAVIIATTEQNSGNYKHAHTLVTDTVKQLEEHKVRVPQKLRRTFVLLHSYVLVKKLVQRGNHAGAARMLLRVAESISLFPKHKVTILTSTVITCSKAGLKASALEYAQTLMKEYRKDVDAKFKRKIEALVRKPKDHAGMEGDLEVVPLSKCPVSSELIEVTSLECPSTKDALPMCVVTGNHVVAEDFCLCPRSGFPAIFSEYVQHIEDEAKMTPQPQVAPDSSSSSSSSSSSVVVVVGAGVGGVAPGGSEGCAAGGGAGASAESGEATDPVTGAPVALRELIRLSVEEARTYIAAYNLPEDKESDEANARGPASSPGK